MKNYKKIKLASVGSNFEREPLVRPFGFKGGYLSELWQGISLLQSVSGIEKIGLSTQSTLWSDAKVFSSHTESGGNTLMYAIMEYALQLIEGESFRDPIELQKRILDEVY